MDSETLVREFMKPGTYDEKVAGPVSLVQTHISWVFLTGRFAYKIKKPVNFGFLDFSSLESRKRFSDLELELNRRLCRDIYLGVLPVVAKDGGLRVGGEGEPVEYVLKMVQLPQDRLMDKMLAAGKVGMKTVDDLASILSGFHFRAEASDEISRYGSPESMMTNWSENFSQTEPFVGRVISAEDFSGVKKRVGQFMADKRDLLDKRVRERRVRRIHGDLHTGNIFVSGVRPQIFDCIEFNMRFSCMDVAADVAFLSMDLEYRGRPDLSGFFTESYLRYSRDYEMLKLLNFYRCYYAWVRGKVAAFRLEQPLGGAEKAKAEADGKRYFKLAVRYSEKLGS